MKKKSIFLILIILFVSMLAVSQVSAEDTNNMTLTEEDALEVVDTQEEIDVEDDIDCLQTSESEDLISGDEGVKSFGDIQTMIDNAEDGDTIKLSGKYVGNGEAITIDKDITLVGDEDYTYLDSDGSSRIFYVTASDVLIKNMVLRYGKSYTGGAAYGGSYYNCLFGYSEATDYGGALHTVMPNNVYLHITMLKKGEGPFIILVFIAVTCLIILVITKEVAYISMEIMRFHIVNFTTALLKMEGDYIFMMGNLQFHTLNLPTTMQLITAEQFMHIIQVWK